MATAPAYTSVPRIGVASVSTANTGFDGTGTIATVLSAVAAGTRVDKLIVVATGDPADSMVNWFIHDGSNFWYFDSFDMGNPAAGSTTVAPYREERPYSGLVLPSGFSLRASVTVALTAGVLNCFAVGADLT